MWFAIGFAGAAVCCAYGWIGSFLRVALVLLICAAIILIACRWARFLRIPASIYLAAAIGFGCFWVYDTVYLSSARYLDGKMVIADVEITDYSYQNDYGWVAEGNVIYEGKGYSVLLYLNDEIQASPGDTLHGSFLLRYTANGGEREPTYHRSQGIFLLAYQKGEISLTPAGKVPLQYLPVEWKDGISNRIDDLFSTDAAAFLKALLVGERVDIDYATNTAFKVSGISHIIAVSGLHMSVLFGAVYVLTFRNRWLSGIIGIPVMVLFAAMVGFTPSVTRACIMHCVMLLGLMFNKEFDSPTALAASVIVMLLVNPMVVISMSFQLSVACMVGILLASGKIRIWMQERKFFQDMRGRGILSRIKRGFVNSVSVSLSASIFTAPLVAYYFDTISLISVLTNLLTVWVVSYIFILGAVALIVSFFSHSISAIFAAVTTFAIRYITGTAGLLSQIPFAAVYTQSDYIVVWFAGVYVMLAVVLLLKRKPILIYSCSIFVTLCLAVLASWAEPRMDDYRVTVLNVGQGQCILLQAEGKTFLVDCGGDSDTGAADVAAKTLMSQGIYKLDGIMLTHYDVDHVGGIPYLLTQIDTSAVFLPNLIDEADIQGQISAVTNCSLFTVTEDTVLTFGTTKITLFAPELPDDGNEYAMCVLFQPENYDILITGDRGMLGEALLMDRYELPELEVLIAGHHGSAYSTGEKLLRATTPQVVIVSAGEGNRYGHPAAALLKRLEEYHCHILRTDKQGTIIVRG